MATVTISYEEYQDLLASKTNRENFLEERIKELDEKYWKMIEKYQPTLVKITKYPELNKLNDFLLKTYNIELRHYNCGSNRLERVSIESSNINLRF